MILPGLAAVEEWRPDHPRCLRRNFHRTLDVNYRFKYSGRPATHDAAVGRGADNVGACAVDKSGMRRDVFIQNDSGGFSVLAADAATDIIADGRADDMRFVTGHKAMLLELYGDDSMPVRIVIDEPLTRDEEAQWLARATWRIDTSDGRLLVMGGFDPDVLADWKDKDSGNDGWSGGVAVLTTQPGSWRVDVYAHVGSMNGRQILREFGDAPGAAFRRSHPARPLPLWLARMLEFCGQDDPGFDGAWEDVKASMDAGTLTIDTESGDAIGFLVHVTRMSDSAFEPPEGGWFARDGDARVPDVFPLGLTSGVPDPELRSFYDKLLGREAPEPERPLAGSVVEIIEVWSADPLKKIEGGPVVIDLAEVYLLYWMTAMTSDSPPRFELWVERAGAAWTPPAATADVAVVPKAGGGITAIGPSPDAGGWTIWWTARTVGALAGVADGAILTLAMTPRLDYDDTLDPAVGRAIYEGRVAGGKVQVGEASPTVGYDTLEQALAFVRDVVSYGRISVRRGAERAAFDAAVESYVFEEDSVTWDGDTAMLGEPDERTLLLLASAVFRVRFAGVWPMAATEP
jgi:hypothetical protein